jgi:hypothetical protein
MTNITPAIERAIAERLDVLRERYSALTSDDGALERGLRRLALDQSDEQSAIAAVQDAGYDALAYAYDFL